MSIATTTQFWTTRWNGGDPAQASSYFGQDNEQFSLVLGYANGGVDDNGSWKIAIPNGGTPFQGGFWEQAASGDAFTAVFSLITEHIE